MTSKQRVLCALEVKKPDRVPFMDNIDPWMERQIVGKDTYDKVELAQAFGLDAIGYDGFLPPIYAQEQITNGKKFFTKGLISCKDDLSLVKLPDPENESYYDEAKRFVDKYGDSKYALYARTRIGISPVLLSMGIEGVAYNIADDTGVVEKLLDMYTQWAARVVEHINKIGFDCIWFFDDIAFGSGPLVSPSHFREVFLPRAKAPAKECKLPWIYHSDGCLMPIFEDLLTLGMNAIHPFEPGAMDIEKAKRQYGHKICLIGNIDLHYTLTRGTEQEVDAEVKQRIQNIGKDGGYIISSSNTITDYCKVGNVRAMVEAIHNYSEYK